MASIRPALTQLRGQCQTSAPQWQQLQHRMQGLHISPKARHTRPLSTRHSDLDNPATNDGLSSKREADRRAMLSKMIATLNAGGATQAQVPEYRSVRPPAAAAQGPTFARNQSTSNGYHMRNERRQETYGREDNYRPRDRNQQLGSEAPWNGQNRLGGQPQFGDGAPWMEQGDRGESGGRVGRSLPSMDVEALEEEDEQEPPPIYARPMPTSPSYFSRQPEFNDSYLELQKLYRKYAHLPTAPSDQIKKVAFRNLKDYRLAVGEEIKAAPYAKCITLVKSLYKIHPDLKSPAIQDAIAPFLRDINPHNMKVKDIPVDKFGRTLGVGKRKTSVARAWVVEGVGEVLVNGKSLADAFGRIHDRESAVWALKATARTDKYNVWALVEGGGTTGQAEALAMAVGKALMAHEPALKPALRRAGVVTRDPRGVERKKTGHLKARKKPAWVKR